MKVGILGSGDVGQALGNGFLSRGHEVKLGAREATNEKAAKWAAKHGDKKATAGTFRDAAAFGETLVLATLWSGTENALSLAGKENFKGKVVLDVTNPLVFEPGKPPRLALGHTDSGGEQVQRWLPGARVVKVFNTVGNAHMVDPKFPGGPPTMFLSGNDASARAAVTDVCKAFGWETVDLGGIEGARLLEPLCILWVQYGASTGTWNHAFKLLKK
jgi:predicted dinucleotide-binding enzyme